MELRTGTIDMACSRVAAVVTKLRRVLKSNAESNAESHATQGRSGVTHMHGELEARLGSVERHRSGFGHTFKSGVPRDFMKAALDSVQSFKGWSEVTDWRETHDFYYSIDTGSPVRTSVEFDDGACVIHKTHVRKMPVMRVDLCHASDASFGSGSSALDARVDFSVEETVPECALPVVTNEFACVRIKQRRSFYLHAGGAAEGDPPTWRYDFTLSWSGRTKGEAERQQRSAEPTYEVEVELVDPGAYLADPEHTDAFTATSLLMKVCDFVALESPSFHFEPMPQRPAHQSIA